jgi:hypothetical protein
MSMKRLNSEQVARKVGLNLKHRTIIIIMIWLCALPGCASEYHMFSSSDIFIILLKPTYEQDVCYTLLCVEV